MPCFVGSLAVFDSFFAVLFRRYAGSDLLFGQPFSDFVAVVAAISDQCSGFWQVFEQHIGTLKVASLPFGQMKPNGSSEVVT